jgi:hypothetical protein
MSRSDTIIMKLEEALDLTETAQHRNIAQDYIKKHGEDAARVLARLVGRLESEKSPNLSLYKKALETVKKIGQKGIDKKKPEEKLQHARNSIRNGDVAGLAKNPRHAAESITDHLELAHKLDGDKGVKYVRDEIDKLAKGVKEAAAKARETHGKETGDQLEKELTNNLKETVKIVNDHLKEFKKEKK